MRTKILYVEDEEGWQRMVGSFLKLEGYQVLAATSPDSALLQAEQGDVGVIILDLHLAGTDASQLIGFLKANRPTTQVIVYTGVPDAEASFRELRLQGADQCLQKGNLRQLLAAVQAASRRVAMGAESRTGTVLRTESAAAPPPPAPEMAAASA